MSDELGYTGGRTPEEVDATIHELMTAKWVRQRPASEFPADVEGPCDCGLTFSTVGGNYSAKMQEGDVMRWLGVRCLCGKSYTVEAVADEDAV